MIEYYIVIGVLVIFLIWEAFIKPGVKLAQTTRTAMSPIPRDYALGALLSVVGTTTTTKFLGVTPRAEGQRRRFFAALSECGDNIVLFESSARMMATIAHLRAVFGDSARLICAREMTKQYGQITDLSLAQTAAALTNGDIPNRGRFALLLFSRK